jgi:hypothetical protein
MNTRRSDKLRTKSNLAHCQNVATIKVPISFSIWQQLFGIGATQHNDAQEQEIQDEWNISKTRPSQCRTGATDTQQVNEHVHTFTITTFEESHLRPRCVAQANKQGATRSCHLRKAQLLQNDQTGRTRNNKE